MRSSTNMLKSNPNYSYPNSFKYLLNMIMLVRNLQFKQFAKILKF